MGWRNISCSNSYGRVKPEGAKEAALCEEQFEKSLVAATPPKYGVAATRL